MKAKVFIASSSEGLEISRAIQANLDYDFETTIWSQDIFKLSSYSIESLINALDKHDFGIFVFSPDDQITIRDSKKETVRDNVIFELGLFVGRYGKNFNFIVQPRNVEMHIPSDLFGLTTANYETNRSDGNLKAALGQACTQIRNHINELLKFEYPESGHYGENILNKEVDKLELNKTYSFRAKLKRGQELKLHLNSQKTNFGTWSFSTRQIGDWNIDNFDNEKREQFFYLKGPTDSDLKISFGETKEINFRYYENSDEPTFTKNCS